MNPVPLPSDEVVPLDDIAPGVKGIRNVFVNVFTIESPDGGWTLIDTGLPLSSGKIKSWVESQFGAGARPDAIVLTHGHFDHVGTVEALVNEWQVPVYAHRDELPFLTQQQKYPPPDPGVGGGLMAVMSPLYPRASANLTGRVHALPDDGTVPTLAGWKYFHTPGHAPGHISLYRDSDKLLLPADAFCTTNQESFLAVARQTPELQGPPTYYTPDWNQARSSVELLAKLNPRTVAPGHGLPISGDKVAGQLQHLAANFDEIAMPKSGKYVRAARGGCDGTGKWGVERWTGVVLMGDGLAGLIWPCEYLRKLKIGPKPINQCLEALAQRPTLTRVLCVAEVLLGFRITFR